MKLDRIDPNYVKHGLKLVVEETTDEGFAELTIALPADSLLFQYKQQIQFVFSNRKRADGIVFSPDGEGRWNLLLVELKKTVGAKNWESIKQQWHGAWLHAIALAGVLELELSGRVEVMAGYRKNVLGQNATNPVLLKSPGDFLEANTEWCNERVCLPELGITRLYRCELNEQGLGEYEYPGAASG